MFEELKQKIVNQNVNKIRKTQRLIEYCEQSSYQHDSQSVSSDGQLSERLQIFKMLIQEKPNRVASGKREEHKDEAQYEKKLRLIEERINMEKYLHQRQLDLLSTKHQNERDAFRSEIEKLKCVIERQIKEQGIVSRLKKENRQLQELQAKGQEISQNLLFENTQLKKQIFKLKAIIKQKQEKEADLEAAKHIESQNQIRLKQQVLMYEKEKQMDLERKKQLQQSVNRLRLQNQQLIRERDRHKMESDFQKTQISQRYVLQITRIEEQKAELKRRNQKLQQSFIQHLTQTSANLQQTLKAPQRVSKNSTIYLQESPIKTRSRSRQPARQTPEEEDPQKGNQKLCSCSGQLIRLRAKLQQANAKIVELLYEKCHSYGGRR